MVRESFRAIVVLLAVAIFCAAAPARAQARTYKVGDRVEVDANGASPEYAKWRPGTVVRIEMWEGSVAGYVIRTDDGVEYVRKEPHIRRSSAAPAPAPTRAAAGGGGLAKPDREILDCPVAQKQVRPNSAPQAELLEKLVRCLFEKPAPKGQDGAVTVDITAFTIGTPRKWVPIRDIGSGNRNTNVYPVKATFTQKTFYNSHTNVQENVRVFNCYVNAAGEWECGQAQRIKTGEVERIERQ
jgi:hypothetical protein